MGLVPHLWHSRVMTAVGCRSITVVVGVIVCLLFYVTVFVLRHRLSLPLSWCSGGLGVEINNTTNGTWGAAEQPRNRSYLDVATSMPNAQVVTAVSKRLNTNRIRRNGSSRNGCRNRTHTHFTNRYVRHSNGVVS